MSTRVTKIWTFCRLPDNLAYKGTELVLVRQEHVWITKIVFQDDMRCRVFRLFRLKMNTPDCVIREAKARKGSGQLVSVFR